MIKKGEKESEQRRNAEIEKERRVNAKIGEGRIKNIMSVDQQQAVTFSESPENIEKFFLKK
jgi:hypothetical protein